MLGRKNPTNSSFLQLWLGNHAALTIPIGRDLEQILPHADQLVERLEDLYWSSWVASFQNRNHMKVFGASHRFCSRYQKIYGTFYLMVILGTFYKLSILDPPSLREIHNKEYNSTSLIQLGTIIQHQNFMVVSGYWKVEANPKHSASYYNDSVSQTLRYFQKYFNSVVFYHNINLNSSSQDPLASLLRQQERLGTVHPVYRPIEELPRIHESLQLAEKCQRQNDKTFIKCTKGDKARKHYARLVQSNPEVMRKIFAVWISKLDHLSEVMNQYTKPEYFAWLDGGLLGRLDMEWFIPQTLLDKHHVFMRHSSMCFNGTQIAFRGGIIVGARQPLQQMVQGFMEELQAVVQSPNDLCFDEESILTRWVLRSKQDWNGDLIKPLYER